MSEIKQSSKAYTIFLYIITFSFFIIGILSIYFKVTHHKGTNSILNIALLTMILTQLSCLIDLYIFNRLMRSQEKIMYTIGILFLPIIAAPLYVFSARARYYVQK